MSSAIAPKLTSLIPATLLAASLTLHPANATPVSILYYGAGTIGVDVMQQALGLVDSTMMVTDASSPAAFQAAIASGSYGIGIFLVNSGASSAYSGAINALGTFVAEGGRAIFTDISGNQPLGGQFGITYKGVTNYSPAIANIANPLNSYLSANPLAFINPGYTTYTTAMTANFGSVVYGSSGIDASIVAGNSQRNFVDGFADGAVQGIDGIQLYLNEINTLAARPLSAVPLPATIWLMLSGIGCVGALARAGKGPLRNSHG